VPVATYFANTQERHFHFENHGDEFGLTDDGDYQAEARDFLNADRTIHTDIQECVRNKNGDVVRFNATTDQFAVMSVDGTIKSYYKPMPRRLAPSSYSPHKARHDYATNQLYFEDTCRR